MEAGLSETQGGALRPLATRTRAAPSHRPQNGRQRLAALGDIVVPARQQRRRRGAPTAPRIALHARGLRRDDHARAPVRRSTSTIWATTALWSPIPRSREESASGKILYEEYHPYGTSAYRSSNGSVDVSARRYRYTGKERDDETGLYYNGARYLAAWLGRWTSADPIGIGADGPGLYNYTRGSPVNYTDPSGTEASGTEGIASWGDRTGKPAAKGAVYKRAEPARWFGAEILNTPENQALDTRLASEYGGVKDWGPEVDIDVVDAEDHRVWDVGSSGDVRRSNHDIKPLVGTSDAEVYLAFGGLSKIVSPLWGRLFSGAARAESVAAKGLPAAEKVLEKAAPAAEKVLERTAPAAAEKSRVAAQRGLVHMTDNVAGAAINESQMVKGPIYALPRSAAGEMGASLTRRTGLTTTRQTVGVPIPETALPAFGRPVPIGPMTLWQRVSGTHYTAAGRLDLATGVFSKTGINWNQVGVYAADVVMDALVLGPAALYGYWKTR